jgi:hypothetical protein
VVCGVPDGCPPEASLRILAKLVGNDH